MRAEQDYLVTSGKTIYISDDGKTRSTNKQKVEDYENLLSFTGTLNDYQIGFLDHMAMLRLSDVVAEPVYEAKNKQEFLSIVSALRCARRGWSRQDNDFLSKLFDKEAKSTLKFICTTIWIEEEDDWDCELDVVTLNQLTEACDRRAEEVNKVKEEIAKLQGKEEGK